MLGTRRLAERVGTDRARQWVIDGARIDAVAAVGAGLASAMLEATHPGASVEVAWRSWLAEPAVDRDTAQQIRNVTRADRRDADLAALVRSAAAPGLRTRILAYRDTVRRAAPAG